MRKAKHPRVPNTLAAQARVQKAMRLIEHAQNTLDSACVELSPVRGLVREWEKAGQISNQAKAMWYALNELVDADNGLSLDSEPDPAAPVRSLNDTSANGKRDAEIEGKR